MFVYFFLHQIFGVGSGVLGRGSLRKGELVLVCICGREGSCLCSYLLPDHPGIERGRKLPLHQNAQDCVQKKCGYLQEGQVQHTTHKVLTLGKCYLNICFLNSAIFIYSALNSPLKQSCSYQLFFGLQIQRAIMYLVHHPAKIKIACI